MASVRTELRLHLIGFLTLLGLGSIIAKLAWVQLVEGHVWAEQIHTGSQITVRSPSIRGYIRDRNGVILADNRVSYDVDLYLPDVVENYKNLIGDGKLPKPKGSSAKEGDIASIVEQTVIPQLGAMGLKREYSPEALRSHYNKQLLVPFTYARNLSFEQMAHFLEQNTAIPGVSVNVRPLRHYPFGAFLSHIIGYVGKPDDITNEPDVKKFQFYQPDDVGKAGIEKFFDSNIRGKPGKMIRKKNPKGGLEEEIDRKEPTQGADVYLSIDVRIQMIAEKALRAVGRGAAVVLNPNNGDILAMASVPSFDPNDFVPAIPASVWSKIQTDPSKPLTNRAISAYSPGSTYKVAISLAGIYAGIARQSFTCTGFVHFGRRAEPWRCWIYSQNKGRHGTLSLSNAIKVSCNGFFYRFGNAAGIDNIVEVGKLIGFGQASGIEVEGESPGILPTPQWLKETSQGRERWSSGHTANVSIGQGAVNTTPLQMAVLVSGIANSGTIFYPKLVKKVVDQEGNLIQKHDVRLRSKLAEHKISAKNIELIRKGMWKVVNENGGTAGRIRSEDYAIAGKTGTVQAPHKQNKTDAWFICFAPYDQPKLAICIMVEGAKSGGKVAAPLAGKIIQETFALEKEPFLPLEPLSPAPGNFRFVEEIDFSSKTPVIFSKLSDE